MLLGEDLSSTKYEDSWNTALTNGKTTYDSLEISKRDMSKDALVRTTTVLKYTVYIFIEAITYKDNEWSFNEFLSAIFYIGKETVNRASKKRRIDQHLKEASQESAITHCYERIQTIWDQETCDKPNKLHPKGFYVVDVFKNVDNVNITELMAYSFEKILIQTIGMFHLTNEDYGRSGEQKIDSWADDKRCEYGIYLLNMAFNEFRLRSELYCPCHKTP
uniref:Uncharacterized protein n=1 Tax=Acrobeloides nanus TaxID=290746 RepID=A0A914CAM1_9BILA